MARKTWVLDTETKGTGANVRPLDEAAVGQGSESEREQAAARARRRRATAVEEPAVARRGKRRERPLSKTSTELPPGHVRKRSTGEIGKVETVDPRAGTARVRWLKRGAASTVRLGEISRR